MEKQEHIQRRKVIKSTDKILIQTDVPQAPFQYITVAQITPAPIPTPPGLPSFIEYNETNKTFWNNGLGNSTVNTTFGALALAANSSGTSNTAYGYATLFNNASGSNNTAIGANALDANILGSNNTGIGALALQRTTADNNTGIGVSALRYNTTGNSNVAIGNGTLSSNTTGFNNTAIGNNAMSVGTVGSFNTAIGYNTDAQDFSGNVVLGASATATANNQFVVGSTTYNAGAVATEVNTSSQVWNVVINGVARKILLA